MQPICGAQGQRAAISRESQILPGRFSLAIRSSVAFSWDGVLVKWAARDPVYGTSRMSTVLHRDV